MFMNNRQDLCDVKYLDPQGLQYFYLKLSQAIKNDIYTYLIKSGPTISRPTEDLKIGLIYFDTDLNRPIWWNGYEWVDGAGDNADFPHKGTSDEIPNASNVSVGFTYYDEETKTLYVSNGTTWEIVNCCGNIDDVIIWANVINGIVSYEGYDSIGWTNLEDEDYIEIEDIDIWTNLN